MTDSVPSQWALLVDGEQVSEPGDLLTDFKIPVEKTPIEGPDKSRYGHDMRVGAGANIPVDFNIHVKSNSPSWLKLTKLAMGTAYHVITASMLPEFRPQYAAGTVVEYGCRRGQIMTGDGRAGTATTEDVAFAISGIDPILTEL